MLLSDLFIVFMLVMIAAFIWQNAGLKEHALVLAKRHCKTQDVQFLDDSIALTRIKLHKDPRGNFGICRRYAFEFTATGERRYSGELSLFGRRLMNIELAPHQINSSIIH